MFVLKTGKREVTLEWGTYAMFLYCEKQKIDLQGFAEQISSLQFSIPIMIAMIQSSVVAAGGVEPDTKEVCEIIDECGGLLAKSGPLHDFANYMINRTVLNTSEEKDTEKKNQYTN